MYMYSRVERLEDGTGTYVIIYMYIYIYEYIYMYTYIYIHIHTHAAFSNISMLRNVLYEVLWLLHLGSHIYEFRV